jgi:hypothetical protein
MLPQALMLRLLPSATVVICSCALLPCNHAAKLLPAAVPAAFCCHAAMQSCSIVAMQFSAACCLCGCCHAGV